MNANKSIVSILIGVVLVGVGVLVGYGVGKEQAKLAGYQNVSETTGDFNVVPRSKLFLGKWTNNAVGNVTEITPTLITVEKDGEKFSVPMTENTKAARKVLNKDGVLVDSPDALKLSDVKVGDFVNVVVSVNDKGEPTAERVFVVPLPPGAPS
ncbi:MAG: hypothetical protein HY603_01545 [Parcubacteria group bacterium]|nr:hypothetical protein [Parcubacteria group bacterium]MBI4217462.1 hypothetical protein [Parcubacteria group bacterium]